MRVPMLPLASLALLGALAARPANAQEADKKDRAITVTGTGTVKYRPDGARISFGVRASDNAFAIAWKDNQTQANKLRDAMEALKIAGLQVKIAPPDILSNEIVNNPNLAPMGVPAGGNDKTYNIVRSFQVVVQESEFDKLHQKVLKVLETALTHGANAQANTPFNNAMLMNGFGGFQQGMSITRVEFFSADDRAVREQAFKKAVQSALNSARGAAAGADLKLGPLVTITDQLDVNYGPNFGLGLGAGLPTFDATQQEVNGEIELTIRVRVTVRF